MFSQMANVSIENGTSARIAPDILSEVNAGILAGAYISGYMPGTRGKLSWALSWAFGLNGQTLAFSAPEFIAKLQKPVAQVRIREKNLRAIALLEEWFAEPDDLGAAFWEKFEKDLEANKFAI